MQLPVIFFYSCITSAFASIIIESIDKSFCIYAYPLIFFLKVSGPYIRQPPMMINDRSIAESSPVSTRVSNNLGTISPAIAREQDLDTKRHGMDIGMSHLFLQIRYLTDQLTDFLNCFVYFISNIFN